MSLVLDFVKKEASGTAHVSVRLKGSADFFFDRPYFIWALYQTTLLHWCGTYILLKLPCHEYHVPALTLAGLQQRNSWNVNASLQQICRRLVNSAIKGQSADGGLALNTEVLKKQTVGLLLLGEFGFRVFFWIVWFGVFLLRFESCCGIFPNCYVPQAWRIKEKQLFWN